MLDLTPYAFTKTPPSYSEDWCVDDRHLHALYAIASQIRGGSVVEIGSFRGRSAAAFGEAQSHGATFDLHLVDPRPTLELHRVADMAKKTTGRVCIHAMKSSDFTFPVHTVMVFIDGDHGDAALADVETAIAARVPIIVMHDSQSYRHGYSNCYGAFKGANFLRHQYYRDCTEDAAKRPGELTHRGLLVSTLGESFFWALPAASGAISGYPPNTLVSNTARQPDNSPSQ